MGDLERAFVGNGRRLHWARRFYGGEWYTLCGLAPCERERVDWPRDWLKTPMCKTCEREKALDA